MRVDLRGLAVGVPAPVLDAPEIDASRRVARAERVTQVVEAQAAQPGAPQGGPEAPPERRAVEIGVRRAGERKLVLAGALATLESRASARATSGSIGTTRAWWLLGVLSAPAV